MARTAIAALMGGDALAAVEDLDGACCCPQIDLLANETVRHGIEEGFELDVVIRRDAGQTPFGELVVFTRKAGERGTFDTLKQLPATDAQARRWRRRLRVASARTGASASAFRAAARTQTNAVLLGATRRA